MPHPVYSTDSLPWDLHFSLVKEVSLETCKRHQNDKKRHSGARCVFRHCLKRHVLTFHLKCLLRHFIAKYSLNCFVHLCCCIAFIATLATGATTATSLTQVPYKQPPPHLSPYVTAPTSPLTICNSPHLTSPVSCLTVAQNFTFLFAMKLTRQCEHRGSVSGYQ